MSRGRKKKKSANGELTPLETMFIKVIWKKGTVTAVKRYEMGIGKVPGVLRFVSDKKMRDILIGILQQIDFRQMAAW